MRSPGVDPAELFLFKTGRTARRFFIMRLVGGLMKRRQNSHKDDRQMELGLNKVRAGESVAAVVHEISVKIIARAQRATVSARVAGTGLLYRFIVSVAQSGMRENAQLLTPPPTLPNVRCSAGYDQWVRYTVPRRTSDAATNLRSIHPSHRNTQSGPNLRSALLSLKSIKQLFIRNLQNAIKHE